MSRSHNSRKGRKHSQTHARRHRMCSPGCSFCMNNFKHAEMMEKARRSPTKDDQ